MHPIERLRWVARAPEGDLSLVAAEAAEALAAFAGDPAGLVIASRRPIEQRPAAAARGGGAVVGRPAGGPDSFVAAGGSAALAEAAGAARRAVWLVAGAGRVLPGPLYDALIRRVADDPAFEVVPLTAVDEVAGAAGPVPTARLPRPACPVAAELLRFSG